MDQYLPRSLEKKLQTALDRSPVTAVLGPRQCGKSTLVKHLLHKRNDTLYLDLERPSDLQKLENPEYFLSTQRTKLVCLDEIQRKPDLFPLLRSLIDDQRKAGMYLILGSASRELLQQSAESLAGRISYLALTPFLWQEVFSQTSHESYFNRGGFPPSLLAQNETESYEWRQDFITTFLERDLNQYAGFTAIKMRRLWQMLAHSNGQTLNLSSLGNSLGITHPTVRNYIDLLEATFMLKQIPPYITNGKKRLIKAPKVYLSDTGICAALLNLNSFEQIVGHPALGSMWESMVLSNLMGNFPRLNYYHYRTSNGVEVDFVVSDGNIEIIVECKISAAPSISKGTYTAIKDIAPIQTFIAAPVPKSYAVNETLQVVNLHDLVERLKSFFS